MLDPGRGRTEAGRLWTYARDGRPWCGDAPLAAALYAVEAEIRNRFAAARQRVRDAKGRPIVEALRPWLQEQLGRISAKGKLAEAIRYALARWESFTRFLDDGCIELDTNPVECAKGRWPLQEGMRCSREATAVVAAGPLLLR